MEEPKKEERGEADVVVRVDEVKPPLRRRRAVGAPMAAVSSSSSEVERRRRPPGAEGGFVAVATALPGTGVAPWADHGK